MFRTLIVPLDGSDQAERALPYAERLAEASSARLALVRVALGSPPSGHDGERQQQPAVNEAERYLADVAARLHARVQVVTATPYGDPSRKILETVKELDADAIVMATHGRTGMARLLQGSVAEAILARSLVPVLLIHARPGEAAPPAFDPRSARILVPLDGSTFSEAALPIALQLLGTAGELVLMTVASPPEHVQRDQSGRVRSYLDQQEESLTREAHEYLHGVLARIKQDDPDLHATVDVRVGDPAPGIVMAELDRGADLVVMSTHSRTGLRRAVMGSVAGEVLLTGNVPVMLVGPPGIDSE